MKIISGIYCISFEGTDRVYIGQSTNIYERWAEHKRNFIKGTAKYKLKEAFERYGEPIFSILEECKASELNLKEVIWIEEFNSVKNGFNICAGGKSGHGAYNGTSIYSEEKLLEVFRLLCVEPVISLTDISKKAKVDYSLVTSMSNGKSHTYLSSELPNEYSRMVELNDKRLLLAHRLVGEATSAKSLGIAYPIIIDSENNEYIIDNATKFAESKGLDPSCLIKVLSGKRKKHKGYKLKVPGDTVKRIKKVYPILLSPEGISVEINTNTLAEFAELNNINKSALSGLLNGRIKQTGGWTLQEILS